MKVKDCMTKNVISVGASEPVSVAARLMSRYNVGSLPVCGAGGKLCGVLTDRDVTLRCVAAGKNAEKTKVSEIMSAHPVLAGPDDELPAALQQMSANRLRRLPVAQRGRLLGMLCLADVGTRGGMPQEAAQCLSEISQGLKRLE